MAKRKPSPKQVPIDRDGSLLMYAPALSPTIGMLPWRWETGEDFSACLRYERYHRNGNGTLIFWWRDVLNQSRQFPMTMQSLDKLLKRVEWLGAATINSKWQYLKNADKYTIAAVFEE